MIIIDNMGPINGGIASVLDIVEYDSKDAIATATPLNPYDIYLKPFLSYMRANTERRAILSKVSTDIIPIAKSPTSINAGYISIVVDATTGNARDEI